MNHPTVAVGVILLDGDRVLLIKRGQPPAQGKWSVPGGKVELGETLAQTALRELAEETGLAATLGPVAAVLSSMSRDPSGALTHHYVILDFLASAPTGTLRGGSDTVDARWFTFAELATLDTTKRLAEVITHARLLQARPDAGPFYAEI